MIYSSNLLDFFQEKDIQSEAEVLSNYLERTFLRPNDLNCNLISKNILRDNKQFLIELKNNLNPEDITSNLEQLFLTILAKNNPVINKNILLVSKTKFLQLILSTFVFGFLIETNNPV